MLIVVLLCLIGLPAVTGLHHGESCGVATRRSRRRFEGREDMVFHYRQGLRGAGEQVELEEKGQGSVERLGCLDRQHEMPDLQ